MSLGGEMWIHDQVLILPAWRSLKTLFLEYLASMLCSPAYSRAEDSGQVSCRVVVQSVASRTGGEEAKELREPIALSYANHSPSLATAATSLEPTSDHIPPPPRYRGAETIQRCRKIPTPRTPGLVTQVTVRLGSLSGVFMWCMATHNRPCWS